MQFKLIFIFNRWVGWVMQFFFITKYKFSIDCEVNVIISPEALNYFLTGIVFSFFFNF